MSITTADQTDYVSRLTEYAKDDLAYMRAEYDQAHWGQREPSDAEFIAWFSLMGRGGVKETTGADLLAAGQPPEQAQATIDHMLANGRDWVLSLPLDDGKEGARILRRYEQLTGLATQASIPGVTPPRGLMQ